MKYSGEGHEESFQYLAQKFPWISDAEIKEGGLKMRYIEHYTLC
jgi:hypothetical protein